MAYFPTGTYTYATLPPVGQSAAGSEELTKDAGRVMSDGTKWLPVAGTFPVSTFALLPTIPTLPVGTVASTTDQGLCTWSGTSWVVASAGGGVSQIIAGTNITVSPAGGTGAVTVNSTASGSGSVTSASVISANGFAGTVATATTTPAITLTTSITGPLKGASGALAAQVAADVVGLFSGTADANHLLSGAGTLVTGTSIPSLTSYSTPVAADLVIVYSQANAQAEQSTLSVVNAALQAIGLRIQTATNATSITPTIGTADQVNQANTQATGTLTINNPTGTATDGQRLTIRLTSTNVQTFSWGTAYHAGATALPTASTGGGKHDYYGFIYDSVSSQWDYVSAALGF